MSNFKFVFSKNDEIISENQARVDLLNFGEYQKTLNHFHKNINNYLTNLIDQENKG